MQHDVKPAIDAFKMAFVEFDIILYLIQYICCISIAKIELFVSLTSKRIFKVESYDW